MFQNNAPAANNSLFGGSTNSLSNFSLGQSQNANPLVASIDQASYNLPSTPGSTLNQSLGPLSSSVRRKSSTTFTSANNTPASVRKSASSLFYAKSSSLKAPSSPRLTMSLARNSPYSINKKEHTLQRAKSLYFGPGGRTDISSIRKEQSFKDLSSIRYGENGVSDYRKLTINRDGKSPELILGKKKEDVVKNNIVNGKSHFLTHSRNNSNHSSIFIPSFSVENSPEKPPKLNDKENHHHHRVHPTPFMNGVKRMPSMNKVYQINKIAQDQGYWISPSLATLYGYTHEQLSTVSNLHIGRKNYGQISYDSPVDLSNISNLSDVLGNIVTFGDSNVCVYPDTTVKPPPGIELNLPATVILENVYPIDRKTKQKIKDPEDSRFIKHAIKLRKVIESRGGTFIAYDIGNGSWTFKVPHFSVWGLTEDDYSDGEEMEDQPMVPPVTVNDKNVYDQSEFNMQSVATFDDNAKLPDDIDQFINFGGSVEGDFQSNLLHGISAFDTRPFEDTFVHKAVPGGWGVDNQTDDTFDDEDRQFMGESPTIHRSQNILSTLDDIEILQEPEERELVVLDSEDYPRPISTNWLEQLKLSSAVDSPLAPKQVAVPSKNKSTHLEMTFTTADLDDTIFGGVKSLSKSSSLQYREAAEKLRLPTLIETGAFARFSPGCGKLVCRASENKSIDSTDSEITTHDVFDSTGGDMQMIDNLLTNTFSEQIKLTAISKRSNGVPLSKPGKEISFQFLSEQYFDTDHVYENKLWQLASILFDCIESLGFDVSSLNKLSGAARDKVIEQFRRKKLCQWLESYVASDVENDLYTVSNNSLESILVHLSGNQIQKACEAAVKGKNLHLATILPLLGSDDADIRRDARQQLENWTVNKAIIDIPIAIRKVYEYLGGNTTVSNGLDLHGDAVPTLYLSENLDWKRSFGLKLWFDTTIGDPIAVAVDKYYKAFQEPSNKVAGPMHGNKFDLIYQLLRLYGSINADLRSVLEPISDSSLDFRIPWHIHNVLVDVSKQFKDSTNNNNSNNIGDKLCINFANQLESVGKWVESIFVLSHIQSDHVAKTTIQHVLQNNIPRINEEDIKKRLVKDFKVDEGLLHEIYALEARYQGNHLEEAYELIQAGLFEEAHKTIIKKVAPRAVIEGKIERLIDLFARFKKPQQTIPDWDNGGQIYYDYAKLNKSVTSIGGISSDRQDLPDLGRLISALGRIKVGKSFDIKVAVSIMSSFVSSIQLKNNVSIMNFNFGYVFKLTRICVFFYRTVLVNKHCR